MKNLGFISVHKNSDSYAVPLSMDFLFDYETWQLHLDNRQRYRTFFLSEILASLWGIRYDQLAVDVHTLHPLLNEYIDAHEQAMYRVRTGYFLIPKNIDGMLTKLWLLAGTFHFSLEIFTYTHEYNTIYSLYYDK